MKKYALLISAIVCTSFCLADEPVAPQKEAAAPSTETKTFLNMKQEDWNACGLDKLAKEEREALQTWIQKYTSEATVSKDISSVPSKIQAIKEGAKFIELADGSTFVLSASARKVAVLWNVGDLVRADLGKKKGAYTLTHVSSGKTVKAKLAPKTKASDSKSK